MSSLSSISLGKFALQGVYDDDACSVTLQSLLFLCRFPSADLPNLKSITSQGLSFRYQQCVIAESSRLRESDHSDIPRLKTVTLPDAFENVQLQQVSSSIDKGRK